MNTERSWLIRTTQNQILGPVAKAKVIEFLEKGALGLNDEVTSGNGYWFSLKEKDLVDKFLYGDIPQGYNPISESKSVLSKRDNPDKTTSLNTAPANKTQVLKASTEGPGVLPKNEDLEYPDITLITSSPVGAAPASAPDDIKLPNQDDLEFPDITIVARQVSSSMQSDHGGQVHTEAHSQPVQMKSRPSEVVQEASASDEPLVYPKDDDLEFPDMAPKADSKPDTKPDEEELDFQVNITAPKPSAAVPPPVEAEKKPAKKQGFMNFQNEVGDDPNLTLMFDTLGKEEKPQAPKVEKMETLKLEKKSSSHQPQVQRSHEPHQPEKLLHERKVKNSAQQKENTKDLPREVQERVMPEHLKKRNDNYLLYLLVIIVLIILALFFYYYRNILNKPLPV